MPLSTDPDDLEQGQSNSVAACVFATGTGADIRIHTGAANNLPALASGEYFEVRDHSDGVNNGLYRVVTVTTSTDDYECDKMFGGAPIVAASETVTTLGATGTSTEKSIYFDLAIPGIAVLEQGNIDSTGVTGQAVYSRAMKDWKSDNVLIDSGVFPFEVIDADAGKVVIGQDRQGNTNGFNWLDNTGEGIRTRKVLRNTGWDEIDSAGVRQAGYVGIGTLGGFEDAGADKARYNFGTDTTVAANSVEFDFAGPVNEAIQYYNLIGDLSGDTPAYGSTSTITRATGSFITDGWIVGSQVTVINSTSNDGTFVVTGVAALTLTVTGTPFTVEAWGTSEIAYDHSNAIRLRNRIRDADPSGKTYTQANLASGNYTALRSGFMTFPLSSVTDPNIDATDAFIDGNTPYTGMTLTLHSTPQSLGSDLVGGPYNFGFVIDANGGTQQEVFEWIQRQLRQTSDIDSGAGSNIGLLLDDLATFVGPQLQLGISSPTDGSVFPTNPEGGGSGVYIENLAAASKNTTVMYDNTQPATPRGFPVGTPVTVDVNQIFIDDTTSKLKLYFDYTIRNTVADLVITAGSGADGTFDSSGANLPASLDVGVGAYVRVSGKTAGDAAMNGVYEVTALTSTSQWDVTRRDNATIVTTGSSSCSVDEHAIHTPDAIIVNTDNVLAAATIDFTAPDLIDDSGSGLAIYAVGDFIRVEGSTSGLNDGIYEVATSSAAQLELVEQTITTQGTGPTITLTEVFEHAADSDYSATFDYSNNDQGGRTPPVDADVQAKGLGAAVNGTQYTQSNVATLPSATATTIPLDGATDRNFTP